ncbi:MAG: asparagine synthase (glutamine-hydrolyzing) [Candidatus Thiodiazotropha sp. (ex Epidulcina cf. delphinae)]|nr:asparagine synthase (glutamine-hydrolyzing) [Candidatus Thiodiazotropha sp. (ex Epidulcina cf. delphinae)]
MCGLAFIYDPGRDPVDLESAGLVALKALEHRGPDDTGHIVQNGSFIGHRRLSVIDVEASQQPMADAGGRYLIVYNGEIYNYRELRSRLEGKWRFRTRGDTEVLIAGLILHGVDFLSSAEGMWALALWDTHSRTLLLARDRMGKKPLYYIAEGHGFYTASELPALVRAYPGDAVEDPDSTADYFRYGFFLPGFTAYRDIKEVLPGHYLKWSPETGIETAAYWKLTVSKFRGSESEACEMLRHNMTTAVQRRLVADVEVGAFLSGGIDSSLIVALVHGLKAESLKTFTIGFRDASYDERDYARSVARRFHTSHNEQVLDWDENVLRELVLNHVGQPFADASILPTALVSQLAASQVKVALTGDGGDELFSGYQRYMGRTLMRWYSRVPTRVRRSMELAVRSLPEPMAHHSRSLLKKANLFLDMVDRMGLQGPYVAPLMYSMQAYRTLAPDLVACGHSPPKLPDVVAQDDIFDMMLADALVYLPQDILLKVDRASMAYSLETRAPFLDTQVVELAFSLPRTWHRRYFTGKRMLENSFKSDLPVDIWKRRKQGFGVPVHIWFRGTLGNELERLIHEVESPLYPSSVLEILDNHRKGVRDNGYRLWQIYIYLFWKSSFAEGHG